jgi:large subunit ribosomal protein L25
MPEGLSLDLQTRSHTGKKVNRLRRDGIIPVHIYGRGIDSRSLQCDLKTLLPVLRKAGANTAIAVSVPEEESEYLAFVREIQFGPIKGDLLHVDFMHVSASERVTVSVPLVLVGAAPAARQAGISVLQVFRDLQVTALPLDVPSELTVDLSVLENLEDVIRIGDLALPENVSIAGELEDTLVRLELVREEELAVEDGAQEETGEESPVGTPEGNAS